MTDKNKNLKAVRQLIYSALLMFPALVTANIEFGDGVELGDTLDSVEIKLDRYCDSISLVSFGAPHFPLAEQGEAHVICSSYTKESVTFEKIALTVADDRLVHVEAVGFDTDIIRAELGRQFAELYGLEIYGPASHWLDLDNESLMWISPEGRHLNLFMWHNPLLDEEPFSYRTSTIDLPDVIDFESSLTQQSTPIQSLCMPAIVEAEEEVWLPNSPSEQVQANCFNYTYAGFQRKMELVFGDEQLHVVWVLTAKAEEQRLRELLEREWGDPVIENANWEVFNNGRISLRKDLPELLILSEEIVPFYMDQFTSEAGN